MANAVTVKTTDSIFDELDNLHDQIVKRAYEIFAGNGQISGRELNDWLQAERELIWKPAIELEEKDKEIRLQLAAPGVDPKDIDIEVTPEHVLVKAESRRDKKEKKGDVHISEFASGNMFRSIPLPRKIDPEKVKAEFKNGILLLTAAIAQEAQARKIELKAS